MLGEFGGMRRGREFREYRLAQLWPVSYCGAGGTSWITTYNEGRLELCTSGPGPMDPSPASILDRTTTDGDY